MQKIFQHILMAAAIAATASCSNELEETLVPSSQSNLQFLIHDFPQFEAGTRAVGTPDPGKTAWEVGDELLVTTDAGGYTTLTLTESGVWSTSQSLSITSSSTINVTYAPCCELAESVVTPKGDLPLGTGEYFYGTAKYSEGTVTISFTETERNYSRLRIAAAAGMTLSVNVAGFIPAGAADEIDMSYTLTADEKGNAYLYGTFTPDATIKVMCEGITLKDFCFKADTFSNGTVPGKSYALNAIPSYPLSASHYACLSDAFTDINNSTLGENTTDDKSSAHVAVSMENDVYHCYILQDEENVSVDICNKSSIDLMGHKLTARSGMQLFNISSDCSISNGILSGTADGSGTRNEPYSFIHIAPDASASISGISADFNDEDGGTISGVSIMEGASASISDCELTVTSKEGLMSTCIYNYGECHLESCNLQALSNHCANAAGNDYGQTARAVYSETASSTTFMNCTIYGAHSGATIKGKLHVDGGTYYGYSHGGLYISNAGAETQLLNATITECDLPEGFIDDGIAGTNHAGIYIGGSSNMHIYVDNCDFYGLQQPIVLRGSSGEANNVLYISNSRINLDYTHYGVRNDGSNQIRIGLNNNFGVADLKYERNYELTGLEYGDRANP